MYACTDRETRADAVEQVPRLTASQDFRDRAAGTDSRWVSGVVGKRTSPDMDVPDGSHPTADPEDAQPVGKTGTWRFERHGRAPRRTR
ncbi:MAG: hypothetical protein D6788_10960 [Planctomycetota bacterium]|nr:MAG: hypothetical protein D6788_10960 [Planctomycetota bacterium]